MSDSHVNASGLVVTLTDYDERTSPYEGRALRISISADVAFVYVGKFTEDRSGDRFEHEDAQSVGVDAQALYEALGVMLRRSDRETAERLREGSLPADHPSLVVVETSGLTAGVRRRA